MAQVDFAIKSLHKTDNHFNIYRQKGLSAKDIPKYIRTTSLFNSFEVRKNSKEKQYLTSKAKNFS